MIKVTKLYWFTGTRYSGVWGQDRVEYTIVKIGVCGPTGFTKVKHLITTFNKRAEFEETPIIQNEMDYDTLAGRLREGAFTDDEALGILSVITRSPPPQKPVVTLAPTATPAPAATQPRDGAN